jgi:gas vesicle protein
MSKENGDSSFVTGLIVGGVVGVAAAILLAPRAGRETRRILNKSAQALPEIVEDIYGSVELQKERLSESATKNWHRLKDAIAAGIEASRSESEELTTVSDVPDTEEQNPS